MAQDDSYTQRGQPMSSYAERLKDPRWQRRRLEILSRADFACKECGAKDRTLHVHHKLYRKGAMPWEYEDRFLVVLCESCHAVWHRSRSCFEEWIAALSTSEFHRVFGYVEALVLLRCDVRLRVLSADMAEGFLDALWRWNSPGDKPDPASLVDHGTMTTELRDALGEGVMPLPPRPGVLGEIDQILDRKELTEAEKTKLRELIARAKSEGLL